MIFKAKLNTKKKLNKFIKKFFFGDYIFNLVTPFTTIFGKGEKNLIQFLL